MRRFDRLREQAETLLDATDPGRAFFDFFSHLVVDAATKIAITEALLEADGDSDGDAARASNRLRRAVGALLQHAQHAGAVRDDVELPEVHALLVATSRAAAHAHLDQEIRARVLAHRLRRPRATPEHAISDTRAARTTSTSSPSIYITIPGSRISEASPQTALATITRHVNDYATRSHLPRPRMKLASNVKPTATKDR